VEERHAALRSGNGVGKSSSCISSEG
jgi:hypothetical protein